MPAKKAASVSPIRPKRTAADNGVAEVIDFDTELKDADKARASIKFRIGGFDYSLGKGPNPYTLQNIDTTENFDITEFIASYIIPSQRARFLKHIREADYDHSDFNLLQRRIMEASVGRPIAAS